MTSISRVRSSLSGFPGGPGVATMYFLDTLTAVPSVRAFWDRIKLDLPLNVTIAVEPTGDVIESTTGALVGSWSATPVAIVQGSASGAYPAPAGACVTWLTSTILDGHRVRGRTFVVPLGGGNYESNGSLLNAFVTELASSAAQLVIEQSASLVVWHRPRAARLADGSRPAVAARAGGHGLVTGHRVTDKAAVLRSRRD